MNNEQLDIQIVSPTGMLYEGKVHHVTFPGELGLFSIYPLHAAFISTLKKGTIACYKTEKDKQTIEIQSGFVEVKNNRITACVE